MTLSSDGHQITCCPAQAKVLLLFTESILSMNELIAQSPFQPSATRILLRSLQSCCEVNEESVRLLPLQSDLVLPPLYSLPRLSSAQQSSEALVDEEMRMCCEVMAIVKRKRRISEVALLKAIQRIRNEVNAEEVRKGVEILLEKEYVERDESNPCVLVLVWIVCWKGEINSDVE